MITKGNIMSSDKFVVHSSAFEHSKSIPTKYANTGISGGKNISLPLEWEHIPEGTKSIAVSIIDLHPIANNWVHWVVFNISVQTLSLHEGISTTDKMPRGTKELWNSFGLPGYGGPQPPKGSGQHKYEITLYALSVAELKLPAHSPLRAFRDAIDGKVIATAKTYGVFEKQ